MFETITCNLEGDGYRTEYLGGREFLVCNAVILTEGVHPGSSGPGFYSKDVLARRPGRWDLIPIVNYHPKKNGKFISAKSPGVLANSGLGQMFDSRFDKDRIRTETWMDRKATEVTNPQIIENIKSKTPTELSTGLTDPEIEVKKGVFNEEPYEWELKEYTADHLAILLGGKGACSVEKGCALGGITNCECGKNRPLTGNEQSFDSIEMQVRYLLEEKYQKPGYYWTGYLVDVFKTFFIYRMDGKLYQQAYTVSKDVVTLSGDVEEVVSVTEYRTVANSYIGDAVDLFTNLEAKMAKKFDKAKWIEGLIGNGFDDKDKEWLTKLDEEQLKKIQPKTEVVANEDEDEDEDEEEEEEPKKKVSNKKKGNKKVVANSDPDDNDDDSDDDETPKTLSMKDWLKAAPKEAKAVWNHAVQLSDAAKHASIEVILANAGDAYTKEELQAMEPPQLEKLAKAVSKGTPSAQTVNGFILPGTNYTLANGTTPQVNGGGPQKASENIKPLRMPKATFSSPFAKNGKQTATA